MKIVGPYGAEATDPSSRKQRLEAVLSAWRFPRFAYWAERGTSPPATTLSSEELALWLKILRAAEPVPPRTHIDGLRTHARLLEISIDELIAKRAVLIVDDLVAVRGQAPGLGLHGHSWSLLVPASIDGKATQEVLRKRFQEVEEHGDELLATGSSFNCTDSVAALVHEAVMATGPTALSRLWKISLALHLEYRYLPALPAGPAKSLADLLGRELANATARLTVETDIQLLGFAAGREDVAPAIPALQLPASRLARLLEVERFFEHARHYVSDWYYDTVASAFVRVADKYALADVLRKLEPGSALISALDAVCLDRPEFIATYVGHIPLHAEGAYALLQLPQQMALGYNARQFDLKDEWSQAQPLARELLLLNDQARDWSSLVALGIHDESKAIHRRHYGLAPIDRNKAQCDGTALWTTAIADAGRGQHYVEALTTHFAAKTPHSDAAIVFALRLLGPLRDSGQASLASRLATAIADAYVAGLSSDPEVLAVPTVLCAYGALLADLREALGKDSDTWQRFLRPFEPGKHLDLAVADQSRTVTSTHRPAYNVPRILRAHAETLVALASASEDFDEPLQAALELYDADRKAALHVGAFSWHSLARITSVAGQPVGEPLFVAIGRLFGRDAGDRQRLDTFLGNEHPAHILASVAAGLRASPALAETVRPRLRTLINALLADSHGLALGHALELANILQQASMPRDSERLARRALQIVDGYRSHARDPYGGIGRSLLAGALAQQELWPELLAFEAEGDLIVLSPHARFVENMRALALIESARFGEAEAILRRMLEVDATNKVALVNLTALHLRARDWPKVLEATAHAKTLLSGEDLDHVLINEAHAREQLGDRFSAARLLDALTGEAKTRADVVGAREELRHEGRTAASSVPEVASAGGGEQGALPNVQASTEPVRVAAPPEEGIDIAIVTALDEEYDAVLSRLLNPRDPPQVRSPFPNLFGWKLGEIAKVDGAGRFKVVLGKALRSGNMDTLLATMRVIDRWSPNYVLFSGIAGGIKRDSLKQGDIVLSDNIWHYEYQKIIDGIHVPRHRDFAPHGGLVTSARTFGRGSQAWKSCGTAPPSPDHVPNCLAGLIGSGEKVMDDLKPAFVQAMLNARPEIRAVEMEAAGAGAAIRNAQEEGRSVGFMMVRGISDMPSDGTGPSGSGTKERDGWKLYASAVAAHFIVSWIASSTWPFPPRAAAA